MQVGNIMNKQTLKSYTSDDVMHTLKLKKSNDYYLFLFSMLRVLNIEAHALHGGKTKKPEDIMNIKDEVFRYTNGKDDVNEVLGNEHVILIIKTKLLFTKRLVLGLIQRENKKVKPIKKSPTAT